MPGIDIYSRNYEVGSIGVGAGLYMYDVVLKSSRLLSHLLMSSCTNGRPKSEIIHYTKRVSLKLITRTLATF